MDRIRITDDIDFSRIVYGTWRLGDDSDTSPEHVRNKLAAAIDQGITTMDQADIYGGYMAEEIMGNAMTPEIRGKIEVVTKCGIVVDAGRHSGNVRVKHYDTSRRHIVGSVEASLKLMGIEAIDLLLIHRPDPFMDHFETGQTLDELVSAGKVRAVGVSNFRPYDWDLLQSSMQSPLVTNQIELSLAAHEGFTNGDVAFHQRSATPIMAWSPLGGGSLMSGDSDIGKVLDAVASRDGLDRSAAATAWLLAHPAGIIPVMGTNNVDRIARLSDALKVTMDRQTWYALYTAALGHEVA
ncbi:aldo/keto reductase [Roseisalinus antarcticus]|uniref:Oxidoreductase YdhF n=1 Tax=Roseisalinus antarcticus TaxID=254357 RepID=A0A1Y5RLR4_9RHOB|nr:aldo/keto reductase [Roseisalinus antarcticus]SLN20299.1 Oxidoreductase YdhF [Roseisalinus antarcticus]